MTHIEVAKGTQKIVITQIKQSEMRLCSKVEGSGKICIFVGTCLALLGTRDIISLSYTTQDSFKN